MDAAAIDADPMLRLLTDALRRGPGSPEWHRAVSDLRNADSPAADEYRLLIAARERLESGRAYREVRAGPAFTRELFSRLGAAPEHDGRLPLGMAVRLLCLLTLVAAIGLLIVWAVRARSDGTEVLAGRLFVTPVHDWTFGGGLPKGLARSDSFSLSLGSGGVRADAQNAHGMVLGTDPLELRPGICVEARILVQSGPVVLSLDLLHRKPAFFSGVAESGHVVIPMDSFNALSLVCDGPVLDSITTRGAVLTQPFAHRTMSSGPHVLRLKVDSAIAVAELDGQILWSGPHDLGESAYVGFGMVRSGNGPAGSTVQSLRVLAP